MATERENKNPYSGFNFIVSIDGETVAAFQEVSGLDSENTPIEYREGADAMNTVRKLPGLEKYPNLTLQRGMTGSLFLWEWRKEVRDGGSAFPPVRDVVIDLQDEQHQSVYKWTLTNAWCCKLTGPSLNAKGDEIAIETMELAYDRLDIE
ncbi:MAG: phage tail protein [Planctomycetes bacterium]|nr:phage tail protein [Planctomycetota bacterium]